MEHYGLATNRSGSYYETAHHKQLIKDIRGAIHEGQLIAVCGVVDACGTVRSAAFAAASLREENKITVARSLSIEKHNIKLATLINALFYDLGAG